MIGRSNRARTGSSESQRDALRRDAEDLHRQLTQLARLLRERDRDRRRYHLLSPTQWDLLDFLAESDGLSLKEAAAALRIDKSTASRTVTPLLQDGYLTRSTSNRDRRAVRLSITTKGRTLHQAIKRQLVDDCTEVLWETDPDVRQAMIRVSAGLVRLVARRFAEKSVARTGKGRSAPVARQRGEHESLQITTTGVTPPPIGQGTSGSDFVSREEPALETCDDSASVVLRQAGPEDLDAVITLLAANDLPLAGVEDSFGHNYVVAMCHGLLVGSAGIEVYGYYGLLRSVAVDNAMRSNGLGRRLVFDRLRFAATEGLRSVYLVTTTAAGFFGRMGFREVERRAVPAPVQTSLELSTLCPASATVMMRETDD